MIERAPSTHADTEAPWPDPAPDAAAAPSFPAPPATRGRPPLGTVTLALTSILIAGLSLPAILPDGGLGPEFLEPPAWVRVLTSVWAIAPAALAVATLVAGSLGRLRRLRHAPSAGRRPIVADALVPLGFLLMLAGIIARSALEERGVIVLEQGQPIRRYARADGSRDLPFDLLLRSLAVDRFAAPAPRREDSPAPATPVTNPYPGRLLVQWPVRTLSVRLPVRVGEAPLLVAPGETPNPSNSFRITFLRLVPDFLMNPETHEVTTRSEEPRNPALLVREFGHGYSVDRWLFARFPELAAHEDAKLAELASPLRLRFEADALEEPPPEPPGPIRSLRSTVAILESGREIATATLDPARPLRHRGFVIRQLRPAADTPEPVTATLRVGRHPGAAWIGAGLALVVAGLLAGLRRRPARPAHPGHPASLPAPISE